MERITEGKTGFSREDLILQITHGSRADQELRERVLFLCEDEEHIWTLLESEYDEQARRKILKVPLPDLRDQRYPEWMESGIIVTTKGRTNYETDLGYPVEFQEPMIVEVSTIFKEKFPIFADNEEEVRPLALIEMNRYLKEYAKVENDSLYDIEIMEQS